MMHYREISVFGVYISPGAPAALVAWVMALLLFRLFDRIGLSGWTWHPSLFNFAIYAMLFFGLVLLDGII